MRGKGCVMGVFLKEVAEGSRFEFGKNWKAFLDSVTDERVRVAEQSIKDMLDVTSLQDKALVDIGSGSGLFSLCARNLGAKVRSFDFDPESVECTQELRQKYYPNDPEWVVGEGSILDGEFLAGLGKFDIVYSWGVLHHTGQMWRAIENASSLVSDGGKLFISIYNDQGWRSKIWRGIKQLYCSGPVGKWGVIIAFFPTFFGITVLASIKHRKNIFRDYKNGRGMSLIHDWFDWLGGLPFEVTTPGEMVSFMTNLGFHKQRVVLNHGHGCNQYVFVRRDV